MKIRKIEFKNFGPFYETLPLTVDVEDGRPLVLIRASNDVLKTSFLNAIKFCLFGQAAEPHGLGTGDSIKQVPNRLAAFEGDGETSVVLSIEHPNGGDTYEVKRSVQFKKVKEHGDLPELHSWKYSIQMNGNVIIDPKNNVGYQNDFVDKIEEWVPQDISQFFFFDGQKIQDYSTKQSYKKKEIKTSIEQILGIRQLRHTRKDLERLAHDLNTELLEVQNKSSNTQEEAARLQTMKLELDTEKKVLEFEEKELAQLQTTINNLNNFLEAKEGLVNDWQEKTRVENIVIQLKEERERMVDDRMEFQNQHLLSEIFQLCVKPASPTVASQYSIHEIEVMKQHRHENPNNCSICGKDRDESSRQHLEEAVAQPEATSDGAIQTILETITANTRTLRVLNRTTGDFITFGPNIQEAHTYLFSSEAEADRKIDQAKVALDSIEERIGNATSQMEVEVSQKRDQYEKAKEKKNMRQGAFDLSQEQHETKWKEYNDAVSQNSAMSTDEPVIIAQARLNRCNETLRAFKEVIDATTDIQRQEVAETMSTSFKNLTNQPLLYTALDLDEQYRILIQQKNYPVKPAWQLGPSSGQSAVIAFSFMYALNKSALKQAPIVIDTPTGNLSPDHSNNIVNFWHEFGEQVFILYQPNELAQWQYPNIEGFVSKHYRGIRKPSDPELSMFEDFDNDWMRDRPAGARGVI